MNLARATAEDAPIRVADETSAAPETRVRVILMSDAAGADPEVPTVVLGDDPVSALTRRFMTALSAAQGGCRIIEVELTAAVGEDDTERQRHAIRMLDALCAALA